MLTSKRTFGCLKSTNWRNTRKRFEIYSKFAFKTPKRFNDSSCSICTAFTYCSVVSMPAGSHPKVFCEKKNVLEHLQKFFDALLQTDFIEGIFL